MAALLEFSYNLANLPESVEGADGASLTYSYLSDGSKWRASANEGPSILYRGSFVYEDDGNSSRISSIAWDEGRISYHYAPEAVDSLVVDSLVVDSLVDDSGEGVVDSLEVVDVVDSLVVEDGICDEWHVRDHLGSVRAIAGIGNYITGIRELNSYLPFGTRIPGSIQAADNRHRFGGKEEQRYGTFNLGLSDFGARYYDPFTCRWTTRDPMAGKYHSLSPYNYCAGNPVRFIDDGGLDIVLSGKEDSSVTIKTDLVNINANVSGLGINWGGQYSFEGRDVLSAGLDLVGVVDPTGVADAVNAGIQAQSGEFFGALLSAISVIPGGDFVKLGSIGKDVRIIGDAISAQKGEFRLTKSLRTNMIKRDGLKEGMEAHHGLPKKFAPDFKNAGLNINDPKHGYWLTPADHRGNGKAYRYNKAWEEFWKKNSNADAETIVEEMHNLMDEIYGITRQ